MFLTPEELIELTNRQQRAAQHTVLNALGITHKVRPDGSIAVLRAHVEKEFGGAPTGNKVKKQQEPNWDALTHA